MERIGLECKKGCIFAVSKQGVRRFSDVGAAARHLRSRDVRLFGTKSNLFDIHRLMDANIPFKIGTPSRLPRRRNYELPDLVNLSFELDNVPVAMGGWRYPTRDDWYLSRVFSKLVQNELDVPLLQEASEHLSIWPRVAFVDGVRLGMLYVLAGFFDPRWYLRPDRPNRGSKFKAYSGFSVVNTAEGMKRPKSGFNPVLNGSVVSAVMPLIHTVNDQYNHGPAAFLRRDWLRHYSRLLKTRRGIDPFNARRIADIKGVQRFLMYLFFNWLDVLNGTSKFDRHQFFIDEDTSKLFEQIFVETKTNVRI